MSLIKNSVYNLAGFAIPTLIAVPALGFLARAIGVEAFGIFTLAFAIVGYASIFDAGLSRAVIREISMYRADKGEQQKIISTASTVVFILGVVAAFLLYISTPHLGTLLKVSVSNTQEVQQSFAFLSLVIPIYLLNQVWLGWLEGHEKFFNINIQKTISNSAIAGFPALFCLFEASLKSAILGLVVGRVISFLITLVICREIIISSGVKFYKETFYRLVKFGGWLTVSNIISPLMVYCDRFIISNLLGANKIAYYTAPSEGVGRLLNIPAALSRALFPKLSYAKTLEERTKLEKQSFVLMTVACLPVVIVCLLLAQQLMTLWMGAELGEHSANILRVLIIGFYMNSIAQIPYSSIQALGRAKITAFIHMCEIVPYLLALYLLTLHYGLLGTAIAWTARMTFDALVLIYFSRKIVKLKY